jgi:hypothetical protein
MEWHYAKNGSQEGPVSGATLKNLIMSGEVASTDLVWREGMSDWRPAAEISDFESDGVAQPAGIVAPPGGLQIPQGGVPQPGQVPGSPVAHAPISNYLVPAILVTVLCCVPFGIPAIVFAAKVDGLVSRGDIAGALEASKKAKTWTWVSFGCGFGVALLYVLLMVIGVAAEL